MELKLLIKKSMYFIRQLIISILIFSSFCANAQKEDFYWIMGYQSPINLPDTGFNKKFGNTVIDFNTLPIVPYRKLTISDFDYTCSSICDKNGSLLLYTNGTKVFNKNNNLMENGDSINAGYLQFEWDTSMKQGGYRDPQGVIILQVPNNDSLFYILHLITDSSSSLILYQNKLLHTLVNIKANNGLGRVIYKDSLLIHDTFSYFISACRHANGKDWWIFTLDANTNQLHRLLLTQNGIEIKSPAILDKINPLDLYQACFSPDGKKFILYQALYGLTIYNFDRCSGSFSNPQYCPIPEVKDSTWYGIGISISANSRFAYATLTKRIYQYDLLAIDINASKVQVAEYDEFFDEVPIFKTIFNVPQLAPDNKIYISTGSTSRYLHTIENPDLKGLSCNVLQHNIKVPTNKKSVPYFPNYRLGKDSCYGSNIVEPKEVETIVYPNPATNEATIEFKDILSGDTEIILYDIMGRIVFKVNQELDDKKYKLNLTKLHNNIYILKIYNNGTEITNQKINVLH